MLYLVRIVLLECRLAAHADDVGHRFVGDAVGHHELHLSPRVGRRDVVRAVAGITRGLLNGHRLDVDDQRDLGLLDQAHTLTGQAQGYSFHVRQAVC